MDYIAAIVLLCLGIKDVRERELSLCALSGVLLSGILFGLKMTHWRLMVLGSLPGVVLCLGFFLFPQGIGLADGMIAISYGLVYGWKRTCIWLMLSFLSAAVVGSICCLKSRRKHIQLPFVPFLFIAHIGLCL